MKLVIIIIIILCLLSLFGSIIFYYFKYLNIPSKPSIPAPSIETYPLSSVWKNGEILKVNDYKISPNGKIKLHVKSVMQNGSNTIYLAINDGLNSLSGMTGINTGESNSASYKLQDNGIKKIITTPTSEGTQSVIKSEDPSQNTISVRDENIDGLQIEYMLKNNNKYPIKFKLNSDDYDFYDENGNFLGTNKFDPFKKSDFKYVITNTQVDITNKINYIVVKDDGIYLFNKNNKFISFLR